MKRVKSYFKKRGIRLSKNPKVQDLLIRTFRSFLLGTQKYPATAVFFRRYRWYYINLAQFLRQLGDSRGALDNLMKGVVFHKNDHLFYFRISQILRENYEIAEAHRYLTIADELRPGMNTIMKLCFESDHRLFEHGSNTMLKVLDLPQKMIRSNLNLIDRASIYYPEYKHRLDALRGEIKKEILNSSHENTKSLSKAVAEAIGHRQIRLAGELRSNSDISLSPVVQQRLDRIMNCFGTRLDILDTAWENEISDEIHLFEGGPEISSADARPGSSKIVELFLPPAIFDYPPREKQTHETIRQTFLNVVEILCARNDIKIVPRMQLNWRECFPKTTGAHVISYHTSAEFDRRHLHVQESPFAGNCSFDYSGFAGFSHIARNHQEISEFVRNINPDALDLNQAEIYNRYVTKNISKYEQPEDSKPITGSYVFVALQVVTDVVAKLAWMSGIELLEGVAAYYRGTGTQVVVKRHPFCRSMDVQKCVERLEAAGDVIRTSNSIHEILRNAKLVFTVNSGVGLEALMHGKCVIVSGACDYSYATHPVKTPAELDQILATEPKPDDKRIKELLYFYTKSYAIPSDDVARLSARLSRWLSAE